MSHRALVSDLTKKRKDLPTRRTAHYSSIINESNPAAADEFIYELEHEPALAAITLEFDLIHYGDKCLDDPSPTKSIEKVIVHNLRHIQTHERAATAQIALQKLLNILLEFGAKEFDLRRINPRIRTILEKLQSIDGSQLTKVERRFMQHFQGLLASRTPTPPPSRPIEKDQMLFFFDTRDVS